MALKSKRREREAAPEKKKGNALRNLVGVCNHNPYQVSQLLEDLGQPQVMNFGGEVIGPKKADFLFVPSVATLLQYRDKVVEFKGTAVVFDDPVKLEHALGGWSNILDVVTKNHSYQYTFGALTESKLEAALEKREFELAPEKVNVLPQLINAVQGSIAQVIMECTQSLVPMVKADALKVIFSWLSEKDSEADTLLEEITKLGVEDAEAMIEPIVVYLASEAGGKVKEAFAQVAEFKAKGKSVPYAKIEKATGVPAFDLNFAIRYIRRSTAVRRPNMTLTQIHSARKLKRDNDVLDGVDEEVDEE